MGILLLTSCSKDKAIDPNTLIAHCDSTSLSYNKDIRQILNNNCAFSGCHDATTKQSGFDFSYYNGAKEVYRALDNINNKNGLIMPPLPYGKMPDSLITKIETWVATGYCE